MLKVSVDIAEVIMLDDQTEGSAKTTPLHQKYASC